MDINQIRSDDLNLDAALRAQRNQTAGEPGQRTSPTEAPGDASDLSKIGNMLADNNAKYDQASAVRSEKIDQFRDFVGNPAEISDSQVDIIIQRLLEN